MDILTPRPGEDRVAFLERKFSRRAALKVGAAGTAATFVSLYASPLIRKSNVAHAATGTIAYETAYARFGGSGGTGVCFIPNISNNWGWYHVRSSDFSEDWTLWRGAGQCDLNKGTNVGSVHVSRSGGKVSFQFDITNGFTLGMWHIYLKDVAPTSIAPGQFGNQGSSTSTTLSDPNPGGDIYIIVHAEIGTIP